MKVAAIDVGTNSIRTIIAEVHSDGAFETVDQLRDMIRLGEGESADLGLTERAIADGLHALFKSRALCDAHRVDRVIAVATSAVREAANGGKFLDLVRRQTGINLEIISAEEEARLIGVAVQATLSLGERRALVVDVGGGSVEFIIADRQTRHFTASAKLGVLRLLNLFAVDDPIQPEQITTIERYIGVQVQPILDRVRRVGFDTLIVTSGTSLTLVSLAMEDARHNGNLPPRLHGQVISLADLIRVCRSLVRTTAAERRRLDHIQAGRIDSIVLGAVFWQYLAPRLRVREITVCEYALRDGILIDYLKKHQRGIRHWEEHPDPRRRSVIALAQRCHWNETHSRHVAALAQSLFDQLQPLHRLDNSARECLEYAALLHDIGYHISARSHHRHSYYLIRHSDLTGFREEQIRLIAAIARYHRKRKPDRADPELAGMAARERRVVGVLAGILRLADALDRTHNRLVRDVDVTLKNGIVRMEVLAHPDARLEIWFAEQKASLLAQELDRKIHFSLKEPVPARGTIKSGPTDKK